MGNQPSGVCVKCSKKFNLGLCNETPLLSLSFNYYCDKCRASSNENKAKSICSKCDEEYKPIPNDNIPIFEYLCDRCVCDFAKILHHTKSLEHFWESEKTKSSAVYENEIKELKNENKELKNTNKSLATDLKDAKKDLEKSLGARLETLNLNSGNSNSNNQDGSSGNSSSNCSSSSPSASVKPTLILKKV